MELRPADLGNDFARDAVLRRAKGQDRFVLFLFRVFFLRQAGLDKETIREVLASLRKPTGLSSLSYLWTGSLIGLIISQSYKWSQYQDYLMRTHDYSFLLINLAVSIVLNTLVYVSCGILFVFAPLRKAFTAPLALDVVNAMYHAQTEPTQRAFMQLVCDVVMAKDIAPEVAVPLRDAVRLFGESVGRLSAVRPVYGSDSASLRRAAESARREAERQTDPVIGEAITTQAEAHERATVAAERNETRMRRINALRATVAAQIEALRQELPAFQTGNVSLTSLSALTESVRNVAAEVTTAATARAEVDAALTQSVGAR